MSSLRNLLRLAVVLGALGFALLAILAFFGFAVPIFDLFNHGQIVLLPATAFGLLLVALMLRGRQRLVISAFVAVGFLASAVTMVPEFIAGAQPRAPQPTDRPVLRMMTHNLFALNLDMDEALGAIRAEDPDIIVLQEYFPEQAALLGPELAGTYPFSVLCRGGKRANLALYSKIAFALVHDGQCPDDASGTQRTAHIVARFTTTGGKPFTVMTTHMDWPAPLMRQRQELQAIGETLSSIDGPVILAGDFNSTPWAYALRGFIAANALTRQTLNLLTYPMSWYYLGDWRGTFPILPIDHVFTRDGIVVHAIKTGRPTGSDHLPVVFRFSVQ